MATGYKHSIDIRYSPMGRLMIGRVVSSAVQLGVRRDRLHLLDFDTSLVELPEELYLRGLWDLDAVDPSAVGEFVAKFGAPTPEIAAATGRRGSSDQSDDVMSVRAVVTLEAVQTGVFRLRNLIRCWDHLTGGLSLAEVQGSWEGADDPSPRTAVECAAFLRRLEPALTSFSPVLLGPDSDWPTVDTYSALAAQIFNRVVTGEGFKHCEECHRPFTRYESRTERSRSKPAKARFCSQRCSDRYFNREYRRREQVQKLRGQGLSVPKIAEKMNATAAEVKAWLEGVSKEG